MNVSRIVGSAAVVVSVGTVAAAPAPGQEPQLAGNWILNAERSDDPQEKLRSAMRNRQTPETVGGGRRAGRGGRNPLGGGRGGRRGGARDAGGGGAGGMGGLFGIPRTSG